MMKTEAHQRYEEENAAHFQDNSPGIYYSRTNESPPARGCMTRSPQSCFGQPQHSHFRSRYDNYKPSHHNADHNSNILASRDVYDRQFQDDGYITSDYISSASTSFSSPLSSSMSSLSTNEGSLNLGQRHQINGYQQKHHQIPQNAENFGYPRSVVAMQRGPIQKGPQLHGTGRVAAGLKQPGPTVKRRDAPIEDKDINSTLEDRLRALTTIEEEASGYDRSHFKSGRSVYEPTIGLSGPQHALSVNGPQRDFHKDTDGANGYFRAVPVDIKELHVPDNDRRNRLSSSETQLQQQECGQPQPHVVDDGWRDYRKYFEKDCDIPAHNIDPAGRGKFSTNERDNVPDMDINRQIGTGTPSNRKPRPPGDSGETQHSAITKNDASRSRNFNMAAVTPHRHGLTVQASRSSHMSSMPDLRYQGHANTREQHQDSYPGYPFHPPPLHDFSPLPQQNHGYAEIQQHRPSREHHSHTYVNHQSFVDCDQGPASLPTHMPGMSTTLQNESSAEVSHFDLHPEVALRRSRVPARPTPGRGRFSWQPGASFSHPGDPVLEDRTYQHHLHPNSSHSTMADRNSLDLGSIPQLQKQIRATSELCLQASRRHMFASSADIYKLFSGQRKVPPSPSPSTTTEHSSLDNPFRSQSRHSLHSMSGGGRGDIPPQSDASQENKHKLRVMTPHVPMSGPVKANHNISIPPDAWTNVPAVQASKSSVDDHDGPLLQRQSSGYSSENELQQIENNAESIKKKYKHHNNVDAVVANCQEFIPVNQSSDLESTVDEWADSINNEPVYMNQPVLPPRNKNLDVFCHPTPESFSDQNTICNTICNAPIDSSIHQNPSQTYIQTIQSNHHSSSPHLLSSSLHKSYQQPPSVIHTAYHPTQHHQHPIQQHTTQHHQHPIQQHTTQHNPIQYPIEHHSPQHNQHHHTPHMAQPGFMPVSHPQPQLEHIHQPPSPAAAHAAYLSSVHDQSAAQGVYFESVQQPIIQTQVINVRSQPVTISSHVPSNVFYSEDHISPGPTMPSPLVVESHMSASNPSHTARLNRMISNDSNEMTSLEIAQMLEVPFETSVISDEAGDRLSTLV